MAQDRAEVLVESDLYASSLPAFYNVSIDSALTSRNPAPADFDVTESLSLLLSPRGTPIASSVSGEIQCRTKLTGMPDLTLNFLDPGAVTDCAFHPSVRGARWRKEKVVSFVPRELALPVACTAVGMSAC